MDLALLDSTLDELGQPAYRARQVWSWAARGAAGYADMTDLPAALRAQLEERVPFSTLTVEHESHSRDGTVKALFHTHDGRPGGGRADALPGRAPLAVPLLAVGLPADLHVLRDRHDEVRPQSVREARSSTRRCTSGGSRTSTTSVFMGMGEPMMNLDNVLAACERLPDVGVTHRRTAISTVGWIPGIDRLAESPMPIRLALSLHAADDALRSQIMPVNDRYPLADVLAACRALLRGQAAPGVRRVRDARRRQRPLRAGGPARARCSTRRSSRST